MNYKFLSVLTSGFLLLMMAGCVKPNDATFTDFSTTGDVVILQSAGLSNFGAASFNRGSDTVRFTVRVDLASASLPSSATTVGIAVDNAAITSYNTANPSPGYIVLPSANYKLLNSSLTIPAGQHYAETTLEIYTKGLDPSVSYMLPVSIQNAGGKKLSSNLNTVYYHSIGNPLAGTYTWDFTRFNSPDTTAAPGAGSFTGQTVSVSPLGATTLLLPESYMQTFVSSSAGISLSFTNNAGVLSNFSVSLSDQVKADIAAGGFTLATAPVLVGYNIVGNASTKYKGSTFRTYMVLINSSGGTRSLIDNFVKQ